MLTASIKTTSSFLPCCPDFSRLWSRLKRLVYLIARIQVPEKLVGSTDNNEVAAARGFHGLNRLGIGNQRLEWQRLVLGNAHHHEAEGIGHGQAHRREDGGSLIFDTLIDAGADNRIGGHWIGSFELQCSSLLSIFKPREGPRRNSSDLAWANILWFWRSNPNPPILPPGVVVRKDDSGQFEG